MNYSCIYNIKKNIYKYESKILNEKDDSVNKSCNCRNRASDPLKDNCLISNMIYNIIIKEASNSSKQLCVGSTEINWKNNTYNDIITFNYRRYSKSTTLFKMLGI